MRIRHVESRGELATLADMLAKAYTGDYGSYYDIFWSRIGSFPRLKLRDCRVVEVDGEIVSHVRVIPHVMRVGKARLRLAGIGAVGTHPFHRKKGYAAALVSDTVEYMRSEGYDLSLLFGIADFYPRFGYASVLPSYECALSIDALPSPKAGPSVRKFRPADLPAVMDLHRRYAMAQLGSMERNEAYWRYAEGRWNSYLLVTERRKPIGYVEMSGGPRPQIVEAALPERIDVYQRILSQGGHVAREHLGREIALQLPPSHPLVEYCRSLGAAAHTTYRRDAGAMGRIINLDSWARKMCPEWTARLRASPYRDCSGSLGIECDLGRVCLDLRDGKVSLREKARSCGVHSLQSVIAQLTFGYRSVASACRAGEIQARPSDAKLLAALFPEQQAWVWPADRF